MALNFEAGAPVGVAAVAEGDPRFPLDRVPLRLMIPVMKTPILPSTVNGHLGELHVGPFGGVEGFGSLLDLHGADGAVDTARR